jgi:hypothetical protein
MERKRIRPSLVKKRLLREKEGGGGGGERIRWGERYMCFYLQ